jgi:hypothetical protein
VLNVAVLPSFDCCPQQWNTFRWWAEAASGHYRAIVVADDPAALARLPYILAHGAKEGLLASPGT